jgi:hypothetical protein
MTEASSFALARNRNLLFLKLSFILVPTSCTKVIGLVMWTTHSETYPRTGASRMTKLSVGVHNEWIRYSNDWKAHVFKKTIRSVGGHVP